jgi:hypothetical protein
MSSPIDWRERYAPQPLFIHPDYKVLDLGLETNASGGADAAAVARNEGSDPQGEAEGDKAILHDKHTNLACSYNADKVMRILRMPMPTAGKGEVLLRVRATGICGYVFNLVRTLYMVPLDRFNR